MDTHITPTRASAQSRTLDQSTAIDSTATNSMASPSTTALPGSRPARGRSRGQRRPRGGRGQGGSSRHRFANVARLQDSPPTRDSASGLSTNDAPAQDSALSTGNASLQNNTVSGVSLPMRNTTQSESSPRSFHAGTRGRGRRGRGRGNAVTILSPAAPEFQPGAVNHLNGVITSNNTHHARPHLTTKQRSSAPDLPTRIHEDIEAGLYECLICSDEVLARGRIWSCSICWSVFHLHCIAKWSARDTETADPATDDASTSRRAWRCPACNLSRADVPMTYSCWCGKEMDPKPVAGVPPHSCGQTCGRTREGPHPCPHPCNETCHAGPCPPCPLMGPTQACFCGRKVATKKCIDTDYARGWSCGEVCGDVLPCNEHTCTRSCHEGLCGACEELVDARCYCGRVQRQVQCQETSAKELCSVENQESDGQTCRKDWTGSFVCGDICGRPFDCGEHFCESPCHAHPLASTQCPSAPAAVTHCPCGKTQLSALLSTPRKSCADTIPQCSKDCLKRLPCGHRCHRICHIGDCPPCLQEISVPCCCGRTLNMTTCATRPKEPPRCQRTCKARLNCGRHECGQQCCSGDVKAAERASNTKRKPRSLHDPASFAIREEIEAEHICTRICGRMLKCGQHACPDLCHKGPCSTCREAIFEEILCHCGRTILQPPQPCGTRAPICTFPCTRLRNCSHPPVRHDCHGDDETCPKCPFLVEKECLCGKSRLKNQPCFASGVRCGATCGSTLRCGLHRCRKTCHAPGNCEDCDSPCQQICGRPKKACGHPCDAACHGKSECLETKACSFRVKFTCDCGRQQQERRCLASRSSHGTRDQTLECDDECRRLARNRELASALQIDPEHGTEHQQQHVPYAQGTLELFKDLHPWSVAQERLLRLFAADTERRTARFKPMPPQQRAFLHAWAEDVGLESESMDPEGHRFVIITKTPRFVATPLRALSDCVKIPSGKKSGAKQLVNTGVRSGISNQSALENGATPDASHADEPEPDPFNGILLENIRFALTVDEVQSDLHAFFAGSPHLSFNIVFQPNDVVALHATSSTLDINGVDGALRKLKPSLEAVVLKHKLARSTALCTLTDDGAIVIRREDLDLAFGVSAGKSKASARRDDWSQVVARSAASTTAAQSAAKALERKRLGGPPSFVVLSSTSSASAQNRSHSKNSGTSPTLHQHAKKGAHQSSRTTQPDSDVVDNWEEAMQDDEMPLASENGKGAEELASGMDNSHKLQA